MSDLLSDEDMFSTYNGSSLDPDWNPEERDQLPSSEDSAPGRKWHLKHCDCPVNRSNKIQIELKL